LSTTDLTIARIHEAVRLDPESVWGDVRSVLCSAEDPFDLAVVDLLEDLIFWHADGFIERIEHLVEECPGARLTVAWAQVGGVAGLGIERFDALHQRLADEAMAKGLIEVHPPRDIPSR
jgi:hypothetical protein